MLRIVAFSLIFIAVIIALTLLGKALEATIKLVMLGWVNRLLGALFSFIKWVLIAGLIVLAFNAINDSINLVTPETMADSKLYPLLTRFANAIFPYLKNLLIG